MRLVRQARLEFREGTSDKVYEVDLCEVGVGRFVVNFRYGRRGTSLKEGSKTVEPVPQAKAKAVFEKLVQAKLNKGYRQAGAAPAEPLVSAEPPKSKLSVPDQHLLKSVQLAAQSPDGSHNGRPLARLIWRVGQRRLQAAAPTLIRIIETGPDLQVYCTVWALGRLGDPAAIQPLQRLLNHRQLAEHVRHMAFQAIYALSPSDAQAQMEQQVRASLPEALQQAEQASTAALIEALADYHQTQALDSGAHLLYLYNLPGSRIAREALLHLLRRIRLEPPFFQSLRRIFKTAEFRDDHQVFGLLAYRFETAQSACRHLWSTRYHAGALGYFDVKELRKSDSKIAFSNRTRDYLRGHIWRELCRHANEGDAVTYVKKAVAILILTEPSDGQRSLQIHAYDWTASRRITYWYAERYDLLVFNHILYGNSERLFCSARRKWRYRDNLSPQSPIPEIREEAFPELWDQVPQGFIHLLADSTVEDVHRFAVKGLKLGGHLDKFDNDAVCMMLTRTFSVTQQLGLDEARRRFRSMEPDANLVLSLLQSPLEEAQIACSIAILKFGF